VRAVMLMFDSLNRHMLPPYGCDWTKAPNFSRLAERTVVFDKSYVCSMPCMPARRDLLTGRPNFLHRSWGPMEPYDDSFTGILRSGGVTSHLVTDHYHYFETGGSNYHTQYDTWQFFRGQEGDPWIGQVEDPEIGDASGRNADSKPMDRQDQVNRQFIAEEHLQPQSQTIKAGLEFLNRNAGADNWFLQIETFDPHEPFTSHRTYKDRYPEHYLAYEGPLNDWPYYDWVKESPEEVEHLRYEYASLLSMCDSKLGDVLDAFDSLGLWEDTMLIVCTDHGFLLSEHDSWAKCWQPFYEEVSHTPFFVWDPRSRKQGERRQSLVQPALDMGPTLLDFFGQKPTEGMLGKSLSSTIESDTPVREAALFGMHGMHVNVTDGRHVYMRSPVDSSNTPLYDYTLMPSHMRKSFSVEELTGDRVEFVGPLSFTKGCKVLKIPNTGRGDPSSNSLKQIDASNFGTLLFDLEKDPQQLSPLEDAQAEEHMVGYLTQLMRECDAPVEQYQRLGLKAEGRT
jgi:arylsulfatase A-like enzyme